MIQGMKRLLVFFNVLISLIIALPSLSFSGEIIVRPGTFDHFNISLPEQIVAGEDASLKLQAADALNNNIPNFAETKRNFLLTVTGSATVKPLSFDSTVSVNGAISILINDKTAETVTLSITESGSLIPVFSKELTVLPNKLSSLLVRGPRKAVAGERFELQIIARDAFGNVVSEPIYSKNLNILAKGTSEPKIDMTMPPEFRNGSGLVSIVAEKAGSITVEVKDMLTGSSGVSEKIDIVSGPLHSFKILHPKEVIAGEAFDLSIIAVDSFDNPIINYSSIGKGIEISSSGKLKPFPSNLPAYGFINGQARASLRYDGTETITLSVSELGGRQTGASNSIVFITPTIERFEVMTPGSVVAGQKFKARITAYNQLSNVIRNYNLIGHDVLLTTTGTGTLMPDRIPPSEFINGVAIVDLQYNKSEAFEISASVDKLSALQDIVESAAMAAISQKSKSAKKEKKAIEKKAAEKKAEGKAEEKHPPDDKITEKTTGQKVEIENISLVETDKKTDLTIHLVHSEKLLKYTAETEKVGSKKWIVVKIHPAESKIDGSNIKLVSPIIGKVDIIEEMGTALVKLELLKPARYHITRGKDSLNISIKH